VGEIKTGPLFERFETEWTANQDNALLEFGSVASLRRCHGLSAYQAAAGFFFDIPMRKSGRYMVHSLTLMVAALIASNSYLKG
jgi:hypothetical protein